MQQIQKNVTIIYTDGIEEYFEAIKITENGIKIGKFINGEFFIYEFVPNNSIKEIKKSG